jgi:hypothetical protein
MAVTLTAKIAPTNDAFVGMVNSDQVIGVNVGGLISSLPSSCISGNSISEQYLRISNSPSDGYYLKFTTANELTWAAVAGGTLTCGWSDRILNGGTIAHGLGSRPKWVGVSPSGASPLVYSFIVDDTNITV